MKNRFDMTLPELLELYQIEKKTFEQFKEEVFLKNLNSNNEVLKKSNAKEYEYLQEEIVHTASHHIAEKLLK